MTEKKKDQVTSIVFLVFAGALYYSAGKLPTKAGGVPVLNTGFYPQMLALFLGILSVILLVTALRKPESAKAPEKFWKNMGSFVTFCITLVMLVLYPLALEFLGFAVTTFFFILTMVFLLTEKTNRKPLPIVGVSLGLTALIYLVFKMLLAIPFPSGILF